MVTVKHAFNNRTFEVWAYGILIMQRPKLEQAMELAMYYVDKYGLELNLNI